MSIDDHPLSRHAVLELRLSHFRNYEQLQLNVGASPVVLTGANGAGKTTILEALSLLSPGRGLRRAKLRDMDRADSLPPHPWAVSARVQANDEELQIGTGRDPEALMEKRIVKIEGRKERSQEALAKYLSVIWLTPQMDGLFIEAESGRRKFLDRLTYSFDGAHATRVAHYEQAMRERNRLLSQSGSWDESWLNVLEQRMAEGSVAIVLARLEAIDRLNAMMEVVNQHFTAADLLLRGEIEQQLEHGNAMAAEEWVAKSLSASRRRDAASGRTQLGAHRSELSVIHRAKQQSAPLCSTGEQKAMLLAIVLSHVRARAHWFRHAPVLLLDEVVAHLDESRREALFEEISTCKAQAWLTGTDISSFAGLAGKADFYTVSNGRAEISQTA